MFSIRTTTILLLICLGWEINAWAAPRVVASIAPVHSLVAAVMEGVATPQLLLRGGESPHSFSLRPSAARTLNRANVLFWIGPALELPLARILPNLALSRHVALIDTPGLIALPRRAPDKLDQAGHGDTAVHDHGRQDTAPDPHVWLSPANAAVMVDEIVRVLTQLDPSGRPRYESNAVRLKERLTRLDQELSDQLIGIEGRYAVFHDAYQYLEQRYGLQSVGSVTTHPERSPGAAHLRTLRATLVEQQVRCLFSEPEFPPRMVSMLSEGLAIRHAILDPLGADIAPGPHAYLQMMRALGNTLVNCMHADKPQ